MSVGGSVRALAGVASVAMRAEGTLTVGATVRAVAEAIHPQAVTLADLRTLSALLADALQAATPADLVADQVEQQSPMLGDIGRLIRTNQGVIALVVLILVVMIHLQDRATNAEVDQPSSVTVQVEPPDQAEVERLVEENLREHDVREVPPGPVGPAGPPGPVEPEDRQ